MHFTINDLTSQITRIDFITDARELAGSIAVIADGQPGADAVRARMSGTEQVTYRLDGESDKAAANPRTTTNPETAMLHLAGLCASYRNHTVVGYVDQLPAVILPPGKLHQIKPNGLRR